MIDFLAELTWFAIVLASAAFGLWAGLKLSKRGPIAAVVGVAVWLGSAFILIELAMELPDVGWRIEKRLTR